MVNRTRPPRIPSESRLMYRGLAVPTFGNRMKIFLSFAVLVTGFMLAQPSEERDLVVSRTLIEDVSGTLTIADVAHRDGKPVGPSLSIGSSESVYWMRLEVQAPAHGSQVVLFIRPSFINDRSEEHTSELQSRP